MPLFTSFNCQFVIVYLICVTSRSDADPDVLAKYVMALVKKDKPVHELIATCQDQLAIFLQESKYGEFIMLVADAILVAFFFKSRSI